MNVGIGALEIQMLADVSRLRRDMNEAKGVVGGAMDGIRGSISGAMGAIGAGLSVAVFSRWIKGAIDAADETSKMAQKIGVATKDVAGLQLAMKLSGVESEAMQSAMVRLSRSVADNGDVFQRMGIKVREIDGTFKSSKQVLYDVADLFQRMPDGLNKTALAAEVFGKAGADLVPLLNGGSKGLRDMAEQAERLGLAISDEAGKAAEEFNDTLTLVGEAGRGMATQVAAALLPTLKDLAGSFLENVTSGDKMAKGAAIIAAALKGLFSAAVVGVEVFNTLGKTIGGVAAALVSIANGEFRQAWRILDETGRDIGRGWVGAAKTISDAWSGAAAGTVESASMMTRALRGTTVATRDQAAASEKAARDRAAAEKRAAADALKSAEEFRRAKAEQLKALDQTIAGQDRELQQLRDQYVELTAGKEVLAAVVALRYEDAAAKAEQLAATMALAGEDEREIARQRRIAAQLREMIVLRKGIMSATATREAEQANARAADKAVDEWSDASQQIGQALADALMRGGQSAMEYIRGLVRTLVFQPVLTSVSNTAVNAAGNYLGTAANAGLTWATGSGGWSGAGGVAGYGASLANYGAVYSGAAYGTGFASQQSAMLAAQEAGMVSSAGGASAATISLWAAAIAAGVYKANQDWNEGYRRDQARDVSQTAWGGGGLFGDLQPMGGLEETKADFFSMLGFSDKWADLLSGATAVSKLFGRAAPQITGSGIQGTLGAGDFEGMAYADIYEKGGLFRRSKSYQQFAELPADIANFLDGAARGIFDKAQQYGEALGLPVDALAGITTELKEQIGSDAEANKQAIMEALGAYGDALVAGWAEAVAPLAAYGETTVQTIERVAGAILGINGVLDQIGVAALAASIDGGKAAQSLSDLFGGLDNLLAAGSAYYAAYYTEAEKSARATEQVTAALADVGLALPESRAAFRSIVEALDLSTEAGREQFAVMMRVSGVFAELNPLAAELAGNLDGLTDALSDLDDLVGGLEQIMGTAAKSIQDVLAEMIEGRERLQGYRGTLQADILQYQLGAMNPQDRVAALRAREASLFGQLGTAADPVAVAEQLTGVILDRVQLEASLREQADAEHLNSLREQLTALERMQDLGLRLQQFTAGLRSSDLSPLSYREQLGAAGSLFDTTLAQAQAGDLMAQQNLQGNAQAYLQEARKFFGSSADYADVFRRVTSGLDSVGGASVDPQIQALREQVVQLEAMGNSASLMAESSGEIATALLSIDTALSAREAQASERIDMQLELARAQITELQNVAQNQADTNIALATGNQALWEQLELLNTRVARLLENAQMEAAAP